MDAERRAQIADAVRRHVPGAIAVYVFGSVARGQARADSDLDLGLLFAATPSADGALAVHGLADVLTVELGASVDLVIMNDAPVDLVHRVLRDGDLVLETDRSARIRFEVRARNDYFDLVPHLLRYRRAPPGMVEP